MRKNRKLILLLAAINLMATPTAIFANNPQQVQATATTVKLDLNHNTRVYNKKGQKLWSYRGHSSLLKQKKIIKVTRKIRPITDPKTKRYSFHDDVWNWFYLPYKTINGQEYYSIGHGGYIKAVNVAAINKQRVLTNQAIVTITKKMLNKDGKTISVYDADQEDFANKEFKVGQKVKIDAQADGGEMRMTGSDEYANLYRIKGTNQFFCEYYDEDAEVVGATYTKCSILPYGIHTQVVITKNTNTYTYKRESPTQISSKGEKAVKRKGQQTTVAKELYLCLPGQDQPELFYQLQYEYLNPWAHNGYELVKAADAKYIYGPQLKILNTPDDALAEKPLLTPENKAELQSLIDQAPLVEKSYKDAPNVVNGYAEQYPQEIKQAKYILASPISADFDVAEQTFILQHLVEAMKSPKNSLGKWEQAN